jgi:hypothetical protein
MTRKTAAVRARPKLVHFTRILPNLFRFHFTWVCIARWITEGSLDGGATAISPGIVFTLPARFHFIRAIARHPDFALPGPGFWQMPS